jgi:hypothetical protein
VNDGAVIELEGRSRDAGLRFKNRVPHRREGGKKRQEPEESDESGGGEGREKLRRKMDEHRIGKKQEREDRKSRAREEEAEGMRSYEGSERKERERTVLDTLGVTSPGRSLPLFTREEKLMHFRQKSERYQKNREEEERLELQEREREGEGEGEGEGEE